MLNLDRLNKQQRKVVLERNHCLATASPGAGKTRVLTYKLASLLEEDIDPQSIVCLTFTNKAAREMRERAGVLHPKARECWLGTFHSWCARLLRKIDPKYTICSEYASATIMKGVFKEISKKSEHQTLNMKFEEANKVVDYFGNFTEIPDTGLPEERVKFIQEIRQEYHRLLRESKMRDFNMLIADVLEASKQGNISLNFEHILIDEWQDTSEIQYQLISEVKDAKITVIGDTDQSLYSWRGANYANTTMFIEDYNPVVYIVPGNYRSSKLIAQHCNRLIAFNEDRTPKEIKPFRSEEGKVEFWQNVSGISEAQKIVGDIRQKIPPAKYRDTAVLFRISSLSMELETIFTKSGIPYEVIGAFGFMDRWEVRSMISLLNFVANPSADCELLTFASNAEVGLTYKRYEKIKDFGIMGQANLLDEQGKDTEHWTKKSARLLRAVGIADPTNQRIAHTLLVTTGFADVLKRKDSIDRTDRFNNAFGFCNLVTDCMRESGNLQLTMEHISLMTSNDKEENGNKVKLMTIHASKGLEFGTVYVVGLEDGILPHHRGMLEEERRIAFVAMSRAKDRLILSNSSIRRTSRNSILHPSRFIKESIGMEKTKCRH